MEVALDVIGIYVRANAPVGSDFNPAVNELEMKYGIMDVLGRIYEEESGKNVCKESHNRAGVIAGELLDMMAECTCSEEYAL